MGRDAFHECLHAIFGNTPMTAYSDRMRSGEYYKREEPLFGVDLARKDSGHMLSMAKNHGVKMANVEVIDKHFAQVQKHMGSRGDITGCYGAVRMEAGLPFEN